MHLLYLSSAKQSIAEHKHKGFQMSKTCATAAATSTTGMKFEMWAITDEKIHFMRKVNELVTDGSCQPVVKQRKLDRP